MMSVLLSAALSLLALGVVASMTTQDNLDVAFEWRELDFEFPSLEARRAAIDSGKFIPANNLPLGLEVYGDRLFITVPRWKPGVAASLTYIKLSDSKTSPKLKAYPNWQAHNLDDAAPEIISPFRMRADQCGRLWVLDSGVADLLAETGPKVWGPTRLLIYDLRNDQLLRTYTLPKDQMKDDSFFANIAVEDHDCANSYAYLGDLGKAAIVVYSWRTQESWRVTHNYFHMDPLRGEFNVTGVPFEWSDNIFGMGLSRPDDEGYSTLFFHPLSSTDEFSVSTRYLRDKSLIPSVNNTSFHNFRHLGSRGPNSQSGVSFLHQKTGVLFYSLINLNAVACWKTTNPTYTMQSQGRVYMNNVTMVFPNDIKVDAKDTLWVLSDKLPNFMYGPQLDPNEVNFRILNATVEDAIRGTTCAKTYVMPGANIRMPGKPAGSQSAAPGLTLDFVVLAAVAIFRTLC